MLCPFRFAQVYIVHVCSWAMLTPVTAAEIETRRQFELVPEEDADISIAGVAVDEKKMHTGVFAAGQMIFSKGFHQWSFSGQRLAVHPLGDLRMCQIMMQYATR